MIAGLSASAIPSTPIRRGIFIVVYLHHQNCYYACYKNSQKINTMICENSILRNTRECWNSKFISSQICSFSCGNKHLAIKHIILPSACSTLASICGKKLTKEQNIVYRVSDLLYVGKGSSGSSTQEKKAQF